MVMFHIDEACKSFPSVVKCALWSQQELVTSVTSGRSGSRLHEDVLLDLSKDSIHFPTELEPIA